MRESNEANRDINAAHSAGCINDLDTLNTAPTRKCACYDLINTLNDASYKSHLCCLKLLFTTQNQRRNILLSLAT